MIRGVAAGLAVAALMGLLKQCPSEGGAEAPRPGGNPAAKEVSHPITFLVSWKSGFWMDITLFVDGEPRGPFERRDGGFDRTLNLRAGQKAEVVAKHHKDMDPPPGPTACLIKWFNVTLPPNGYEHRQDGTCHAWGIVPDAETQG